MDRSGAPVSAETIALPGCCAARPGFPGGSGPQTGGASLTRRRPLPVPRVVLQQHDLRQSLRDRKKSPSRSSPESAPCVARSAAPQRNGAATATRGGRIGKYLRGRMLPRSTRRNRAASACRSVSGRRQERNVRHLQEQPTQLRQQADAVAAQRRVFGHHHDRLEERIDRCAQGQAAQQFDVAVFGNQRQGVVRADCSAPMQSALGLVLQQAGVGVVRQRVGILPEEVADAFVGRGQAAASGRRARTPPPRAGGGRSPAATAAPARGPPRRPRRQCPVRCSSHAGGRRMNSTRSCASSARRAPGLSAATLPSLLGQAGSEGRIRQQGERLGQLRRQVDVQAASISARREAHAARRRAKGSLLPLGFRPTAKMPAGCPGARPPPAPAHLAAGDGIAGEARRIELVQRLAMSALSPWAAA